MVTNSGSSVPSSRPAMNILPYLTLACYSKSFKYFLLKTEITTLKRDGSGGVGTYVPYTEKRLRNLYLYSLFGKHNNFFYFVENSLESPSDPTVFTFLVLIIGIVFFFFFFFLVFVALSLILKPNDCL